MPAAAAILFGGAFTLASAYALGALLLRRVAVPRPVNLAAGGAALSILVFLTLLAGIAGPLAFTAIGAISIAAFAKLRGGHTGTTPSPVPRPLSPILAAYAVLYFVHAMAPEIQPDGMGYHLGLVAEYLRLGAFPDRVGFYEMVPQGMEMLFLFAFAFGQHSAAKLVHFGFLMATVPLMVHTGGRLGIPPAASLGAALIYLAMPVVGVTGTSTYNDPALVFYTLATFWLLLAWRQEGKQTYLAAAGLAAGFCYAVKLPGAVAIPAAGIAVLLLTRRWKPALLFGAAAAAMVIPWMARNAAAAGNPLAPLFNAWFPNPYFHAAMERALASTLSSYGGVTAWRASWELAFGGQLQGTLGPALFAAPLALLALRRRMGRLLLCAAAVAALPWLWNMGTRFLLPAVPFLVLALAMALPRGVFWALVAVQAVACWPTVIGEYAAPGVWYLRGFPVKAALRIEPEADYAGRRAEDYRIARMIQEHTRPGDRVFTLITVARAYTDRETLEYWHSAEGDNLLDTLKNGGLYIHEPFYDLGLEWEPQPLHGVRFRLMGAHAGEWCVHDVRLLLGKERIHNSPQWTLHASPYPGDAAAAFDDNLATRWRTWGPMRPEMIVEAVFNRPQVISGAVLASHSPVYGVPVMFEGLGGNGTWWGLGAKAAGTPREYQDLRPAAARAVKRAGFRYVLAPTGREGNGPLGDRMAADPRAWGMTVAAQAGSVYLFRIE